MPDKPTTTELDLLLVGGGLANGLVALACLAERPGQRIGIVERQPRLGGNHTWCLHPNDVPAGARALLEPLIDQRWPGYDVRFPGLGRTLEGSYAAVTSARFDRVVRQALERNPGSGCWLGQDAVEVGANHVRLHDGTVLTADLVVDARGPSATGLEGRAGFQKFLGLELEYDGACNLERPILMDACVEQPDGFRFFYVLPLAPNRLLVEETRFSRDPRLDAVDATAAVLDYARRFGRVRRVLREERGLLPMTYRSQLADPEDRPLRIGYAAGLFHPATGYSFAVALRVALAVAAARGPQALARALQELWREHRRQFAYAERLNWLLFHCFQPADMWRVLARFYTLPEALIHRFYALELTRADQARILLGAPPRGLSLSAILSNLTPREVTT